MNEFMDIDEVRNNATTRIRHVQHESKSTSNKYQITCSYHGESVSIFVSSLSELTVALDSVQNQLLQKINSLQ